METKKTRSTAPERQVKKSAPVYFDELSMAEVRKNADKKRVVLLPLGSVEEHGDHLPLNTDSIQPEFVAEEVSRRTGCLIAPPLRYGLCEAARNFPGTISIEFDTLRFIVRDILTEFIRQGFNRLLVMSGHAGSMHMAALRLAAREVIQQHRDDPKESIPRIMVLSDYDFAYLLKGKGFDDRDGHAGTIETSRVMAIRPDLIKKQGKRSYSQFPKFEIVPDPENYFPGGVNGDPTAATAEKGRMLNDFIIAEICKLVLDLKR
ncbi:MAG: creatininase family protein [bacterium]|nr:creatininase family protein [bacterium]